MNRTLAVMQMQLRKKMVVFALPWLIVATSFVINLLIALIGPQPEGEGFYTGGVSSIFIYMMITGIVAFVQTFPFSLGLGIRRSDYYWGTVLATAYVLFISSLILFLLSVAEGIWTNHWGVKLHFFDLPYWSDGALLNRWWIPFVILLNQYWFGLLIGSFFKRFGLKGMLIVALVFIVIGTLGFYIASSQNWWPSIGEWFSDHTMVHIALLTLPVTLIFAALTKLIVRRISV